jgi:hypothetical protein
LNSRRHYFLGGDSSFALLPYDHEGKFIRKGKGFKPGAVTVERNKSMWIEVKDERLE